MKDILNNKESTPNKNICLGVLAHVDAGKTTLSECLLYESGAIRTMGRVDHRDTFLDTDVMEHCTLIYPEQHLSRIHSIVHRVILRQRRLAALEPAICPVA